jgi:hypothetical protein
VRLVDAAELGVRRGRVYENALLLGAVPLGDGPRPRLRFDPDRAVAALTACSATRGAPAPEAASSAIDDVGAAS